MDAADEKHPSKELRSTSELFAKKHKIKTAAASTTC
jgi:hypothetical protein